MGCGGSKFDAKGEAIPARVRPLLRRRIEEIKQRRLYSIHNALKNSTPSKKNLLQTTDNDNENHTCREDHDDDHQGFVDHHDKEEDGHDVHKPAAAETINLLVGEDLGLKSLADSDEEEEEQGELLMISSHDEAFICPGSPSFRVYCIESLDINNDNDHEDHHDHDDCKDGMCPIKTSSQGDDSSSSVNSAEGSVGKTRKKGHNTAGRKIRRVIHKGRHVAKKNLMSVKSCYNPASAAGHDNAHLLIQKAQA